jgi:hypothetical protein
MIDSSKNLPSYRGRDLEGYEGGGEELEQMEISIKEEVNQEGKEIVESHRSTSDHTLSPRVAAKLKIKEVNAIVKK